MKVLVVGGFLGSGKTTTILRIGKYLGEKGQKAAIIVNEIGEVGVDGDIISSYGFDSIELTNGCICCTLKRDLRYTVSQLKKDFDPQILIIEPTGIAFPATIRDEIMLMNLDDVDFAPLVTLVDGSRFKEVMKETKQFSQRQIIDAEVLAINKIDLIEDLYIPVVESSIKQLNPEAEIVRFSAKADYEELSGFIEQLLGDVVYPKLTERKMNADKELNSIQCSNMATYASEYSLNHDYLESEKAQSIVSNLMEGLKKEIIVMNPEFVGHMKVILQAGTVNVRSSVTGAEEKPQIETIESYSSKPSVKILSAVSNVSRSELMELVDFFVKEIFTNHGVKIVKTAIHQHNHDSHNHSEGV
ncbi:GTP-binding protein [Methanohalophilus sp. RSK]|uniref:GTP-binding protein n=1 Tax=Methanohalophilus sp. RSK TaxID=2485783 RepID=UPI000F43A286|nr:GTP-binding protein [Methanohalophilus sp. RSK]RNI15066.1 GTP-binding protein [Methanohalophilus sp. RSK]